MTANVDSRDLTVLARIRAGGFVGRSRLPLAAPGFSVAIADVDRDGVADLLTGNGQDASVWLLLGSGRRYVRGAASASRSATARSRFTSPT